MNSGKKYWFFFEPYVYVYATDVSFILYNTLDHEIIIRHKEELLLELVKATIDPKNCGVSLLDPAIFPENKLFSFVEEVRDKFMGDIIPITYSIKKPIQPLPTPYLRDDLKKKNSNKTIEGSNILRYLSEISIYLYTSCARNCKYCKSYYKQFPFCTKMTDNDYIFDINILKKLVDFITDSGFKGRVNLFAGDLVQFSKKENILRKILLPIKDICYLYCHIDNIDNLENNIFKKKNVVILVDHSISEDNYRLLMDNLYKDIFYVVKSEEELDLIEPYLGKNEDLSIRLKPFYDKKNLSFFKQNVFLTQEDILTGVKSMRYIHQNMTLNSNFFGKIIIFPNGDVYSNTNGSPIGNLKENHMTDIIFTELVSKSSYWMKTRKGKKCKKCLFQYMCPPVSNYEIALNRSNLCLVQQF